MSAQPVQEDGDDVMRDLRQQARVVPPLREGEAAALLEESARGNGQTTIVSLGSQVGGLSQQVADWLRSRGGSG